MIPVIDKLVRGFRAFRTRYFHERRGLYRRLVEQGQTPKVVVIACSDSRVDPAIVLQVEPGDIFSIRNIANLVPPYEGQDDASYHGTSAALEFAVETLNVEHVVVFGHAHCAGIQAMIKGQEGETVSGHFIPAWTSIVSEAYQRTRLMDPEASGEALAHGCERQGIVVSLENLLSFPFITQRVNDGRLRLHGWYFDIAEGELSAWNADEKTFLAMD